MSAFFVQWTGMKRGSEAAWGLWLAVGFWVAGCGVVQGASVSFANDVMAVISKAGCNAGTCHGNANGKGGFKLSLRGDTPPEDYQALTRDQGGRRVNLIEPERSLILLKATGQIAHEGGQRFSVGSWEYESLREWIAEGAASDLEEAPALVRLAVEPAERILYEPDWEFRIRARATFADGREEDVSGRAVYETASNLAVVSADGQVTSERGGEDTVLVRYLGRQVPVGVAFVPERPGFEWSEPEPKNFIDRHIFAKLRELRMNPSRLTTDNEFVRRAYLDLLGILPTTEEAQEFVERSSPEKRAELIDFLLERPEFADYWALKWADLLRAEERILDSKGVRVFHRWIRESLAANKPMDRFAQEIVSGLGSTYENPPANFYRAIRKPQARAEAVAQVFLGTRLQCAQCHNHPFDRWTQGDYYDWTSLFARIDYKVLQNRRRDSNDGHEFKGEQVVYVAREGQVMNPKTEKRAEPRFLGVDQIQGLENAGLLRELGEWMTGAENPFFARAQINRIWYHLFGRGIVDPIDDFRPTNPASHPELLDELASEFARSGFDLRHMIRLLMNSRTYQLAAEPNASNEADERNFARAYVQRLGAEQLLDSQSQVTGSELDFDGFPEGMRAAQLPSSIAEKRRGRRDELNQFLEAFGKPPRLLTCECERSGETTMGQAFQMISGPAVQAMLVDPGNRLGEWLERFEDNGRLVEELYWASLSRAPRAEEKAVAVAYLDGADDRRAALEDVVWGVLNAKDFLLRH